MVRRPIFGEFSAKKKCHEKLKKHSRCKFRAKSTEKVLLFDDSRGDIATKLVGELIKKKQETGRRMLLKQLSSIRYLARQAHGWQ